MVYYILCFPWKILSLEYKVLGIEISYIIRYNIKVANELEEKLDFRSFLVVSSVDLVRDI